jgi:endonuclease-3
MMLLTNLQNMKKQERFDKIISYFLEHKPIAETELHYENPFQLIMAVVLSAQCTDKRVNIVTQDLFRDFPTPQKLAETDFDTLFPVPLDLHYGEKLLLSALF